MPVKKKLRMTVDLAMVILLPILMAYSLIGEAVHEWTGIGMFLLFIAHHILNRRWLKNLSRGRYTAPRILGTTIDFLLIIIMIVLPVSGIVMAKHTFSFLYINSGISIARMVHLIASYWGFVLMCLHLGLHGDMIIGRYKKDMHRTKALSWSLRSAAVLVIGYGIYGFFKRRLPEYLLLKSQFVFFDHTEPVVYFLIDYIAIMWLFATVGYGLLQISKYFFAQSYTGR